MAGFYSLETPDSRLTMGYYQKPSNYHDNNHKSSPMPRTPLKPLAILLLSLLSSTSQAADLNLQESLPPGSQYGLLVQGLDAQGKALMEHNADVLLPPASTLKVVTALAARLVLDPGFCFETLLERQGNDLIIRFSGDPTLSREQLRQLLQKLKTQGGNWQDLWIDDSAFAGPERGLGWPWENLGACYSGPVGAATLDANCVQVSVLSNAQPGALVSVQVPAGQPIRIDSEALILSAEDKQKRHCDLDLNLGEDNHYWLSGCWAQSKNPLVLKLAVQKPSAYAAGVVAAMLKAEGISLKGQVRIGKPTAGERQTLVRHQSAPIEVLIDLMLKRSDNLIADSLLKTLGGVWFQQPGSYRNGLLALRRVLKEKAGIDLGLAILEDGSGLSRSNRITPRLMAQVLAYIQKEDARLGLLKAFPVSGESGTLQYRPSMNQPPLKGRFAAKTGTLFGTKNLAGIFTTAKGRKLVVVQFVTEYFPRDTPKGPKPLQRFEQRLYNKLYSDY